MEARHTHRTIVGKGGVASRCVVLALSLENLRLLTTSGGKNPVLKSARSTVFA